MMKIVEFMIQPEVWNVLRELRWGDRFESDLILKHESTPGEKRFSFEEICQRLIHEELAYRLRGGQGSPYLSFTDKGQAIADRLYEIELILKSESKV